ncbi:MAG: permease [bacterium]|nr:permease [bacterium]
MYTKALSQQPLGLRIDRVVLTIALLLLALALVSSTQLMSSLEFVLTSLLHIAPYLLISVATASALGAAGAEQLIARVFAGRPVHMIAMASVFGALSPFCSCGVIPLIAALLSMGVPLAPVMAFWVSSPVMAPDMFLLTAAELGVGFALAKTMAAISIGLLAGAATAGAVRAGLLKKPLQGLASNCGGSAVRDPQPTVWHFWKEPERRSRFAKEFRDTGMFLTKWMTLAFLLESLMVGYLPAEQIGSWVGGANRWAIPLAVAAGIPAYLNGYAAIPMVSALLSSGMAPGAAMAFMTAGAMTSIPAAMAVFALVRWPVFVWYLGLAVLGSSMSGFAYQFFVAG